METREDFLHYVWKNRLYQIPLLDLDDRPVDLVDPGQHNRDAGPDFLDARVKSEGLLWAGNVEIHKKASDWYQHGHHRDPAFDNVILHVVVDPDCQVINSRGRCIRTVKLEVNPGLGMRFEILAENPELLSGRMDAGNFDPELMRLWLEKLLISRFEWRYEWIRRELNRCKGDWREVFYTSMARAFGQHVNADPFEMLARSVPFSRILEHCPDLASKEAILFGQAGMLSEVNPVPRQISPEKAGTLPPGSPDGLPDQTREIPDAYCKDLYGRYQRLKINMGLRSIDGFLWKFLRLRPDNFPSIRIAQFAHTLEYYPNLLRELTAHPDPLTLVRKLEIRASFYWDTHYRFQREGPPREKHLGRNRLNGLFVNGILPVLYATGRMQPRSATVPDLTGILSRMPAEDNRIIRRFKDLGWEVPDLLTSQALLQFSKQGYRLK